MDDVSKENRYMRSRFGTSVSFNLFMKSKRFKMHFTAQFQKPKVPDIVVNLDIELQHVLHGLNKVHKFYKRVICDACGGNGGLDGTCTTCPICQGTGIAKHLYFHPHTHEQHEHHEHRHDNDQRSTTKLHHLNACAQGKVPRHPSCPSYSCSLFLFLSWCSMNTPCMLACMLIYEPHTTLTHTYLVNSHTTITNLINSINPTHTHQQRPTLIHPVNLTHTNIPCQPSWHSSTKANGHLLMMLLRTTAMFRLVVCRKPHVLPAMAKVGNSLSHSFTYSSLQLIFTAHLYSSSRRIASHLTTPAHTPLSTHASLPSLLLLPRLHPLPQVPLMFRQWHENERGHGHSGT